MDNSIYYVAFVSFQKYKIIILNIVHTPCGSFYYVCTLKVHYTQQIYILKFWGLILCNSY
jgi:hypothetical protein